MQQKNINYVRGKNHEKSTTYNLGGGGNSVTTKKIKNKSSLFLLSLPLLCASSFSYADNYGCEALLCFAGGKGVSECQPTIKRVLKDLAKGKGFPHCSFVSANGGAAGSGDDLVSVSRYTERWNNRVCRDGETRPVRTIGGYYCKTIEINIKPSYAADEAHQKQYFNY